MFGNSNTISRVFRNRSLAKWMMASVAAVAFAAPSLARADDFHGRDDCRPELHDRNSHLNVDIHLGDRAPRIEQREIRVWVPAEYKAVCEQQWIAPVYRTECERIWVADQFEDRRVQYRDHGRWCTRVEHVIVVPGHFENRDRQICVTEGHFESVDRRVLVTEGHYETRIDRVAVGERQTPFDVVNPMLRGIGVHIGR